MNIQRSKRVFIPLALAVLLGAAQGSSNDLNPFVETYAKARVGEFDKIPAKRKQELRKLALFVRTQLASKQDVKLVFICTHNSRRSIMAQSWAQAAAIYYNVPSVQAYSGGLQVTAFNPRAVAALQRAGFDIRKTSEAANPLYEVRYARTAKPLTVFSKIYDQPPNPTSGFAAVMTCSSADKNCPLVKGAVRRVSTPYEDPGASDGTPQETKVYDERVREISREVLYLFSQVKG